MKISIAQCQSAQGKVEQSITNHIAIIEKAIENQAELVVFPELSITGYEPKMAKNLATTINDKRFDVFQQISDENHINIGIGVPTLSKQGIHISTIIFKPNTIKRFVYSKQLMHDDELPYFKEAKNQPILNIKGLNIALGICYETLQTRNFIKAKKEKADIFIAIVAKAKKNTEKAFIHFHNMAQEFNMPVLMANSVGDCDDFLSNGKSAVWNNKGDLIAQLDSQGQGIITIDTKIQNFEIEKF